MANIRTAQSSFIAGEFSPRMAGRSDTTVFRHGAEKLLNWWPLVAGGVRTRPALAYLATLTNGPPFRLVPFVFNETQRYCLVFSNGMLHIFLPDGTLATSLSGPWTADMLERLDWAQFGDTMFLAHPDMKTQTVVRTGATSFTLSDYAFEATTANVVRQPFYKYAPAAMTLTVGATTGSGQTLTLSAPGVFQAGHVGTIIRYKGKQILVATVTSPTAGTGDILETLPAATAEADWDEQAFSAVRGWPGCVEFFNNRTIFAGAKSLPAGFWASKVGAYYNFDTGTALDNEAIWEAVIASGRISEIRHILAGRHVLIFTDQAVFFVPTSSARPFTPGNMEFVEQVPYGSSRVPPLPFDGAAVFVQKTGAAVREALWEDTQQAYTANAISILADHLVKSPVDAAVLYGSPGRPEQLYMMVNSDGTLSLLHSIRSDEVTAWYPTEVTGAFRQIATVGDEVFCAIECDGMWTLEKFDESRVRGLDCMRAAENATPTRIFGGFDHLANQLVQVVTNGHPLAPKTVAPDGTITLDPTEPEVLTIEAGRWVPPLLRPMPVDFDFASGPARGLMKRLVRALITVDRALSFSVQGKTVELDFAGDDFTVPASPATGVMEVRLLGIDREAQFDITLAAPADVSILALTREVAING